MSSIWLLYGEDEAYIQLRHEARLRDAGAQTIRVARFEELAALACAFGRQSVSVAFCAEAAGIDALEREMAALTDAHACIHALALVRMLDPALIARLFYAGATEVITAGNGSLEPSEEDPCMEVGKAKSKGFEQTADDTGSGTPHATRETSQELDQQHSPVSQDPFCDTDGTRCASTALCSDATDAVRSYELDEPDEIIGGEGAGATSGTVSKAAGTDGDALPKPKVLQCARGDAGQRTGEPRAVSTRADELSGAVAPGKTAPVITLVSGSGGCGKTTIAAAMASVSASWGLRTAVVDLDLMFGNLYEAFGIDRPADLSSLLEPLRCGGLCESDVVGSSKRVGPGLTLWGPLDAPEKAEAMGAAASSLIDILRRESDVVLADTSVFWGDAAARAVAASNRCLVVGSGGALSGKAAARAIDLAARVGVPKTCMTSVFNRFGAHGCDEAAAMRFELTCALSSKARIADGGGDAEELLAFGRVGELVEGESAFATSVRGFTKEVLTELGCDVGDWVDMAGEIGKPALRPRLRLPWKKVSAWG